MISVYHKNTEIPLSIRKKESMERYMKLIQWGRANPAKFIEKVFGIELLDFQKNLILGTWTASRAAATVVA